MTEQRSIEFRPAFHRCSTEPGKDYGISEPRMIWHLSDGDAAVSWELYTGWGMSDEAFHEANPTCTHPRHQGSFPSGGVTAGPVDFHSPAPVYAEHSLTTNQCRVLDGPCYGDVGFSIGDTVFDALRDEGEEAAWARLAELLAEWRVELSS